MPDVRPSEGRLSNRRRTSILITCCLSIFIVMVDSTGVNLALPSISREMGASTSQLQWVIDAYLLVLASLMLLSGSMADRLGRRRIFSLGLLLFGLGSALCSVATGPAMLIATRALQAIGGSMLNPVAMAIITNTYPDARRRARAIGVWGAVVGIGMATGPLLGGLLVDAVNWRAVFWVNIPVVVAALILVHLIVPESRGTAGRRVDVGGQLLGILVMATLSFAIITGGEQGFDHIQVLASAAIGALALAAFILVERHTAEPLLDLRYFRSVPFSAATVVAVLLFMAFSGFMFVATLYLQDDLGKSPLHAGLLTMPIALGNALLAPVSGRIVGRRGPRPSMVAGAVALAVGGVMLTLLGPSTPPVVLRPRRILRRRRERRHELRHHQHRRLRYAGGPLRRRRLHRLHRPAGRPVPGRRDPRSLPQHGPDKPCRLHRRRPAGLVHDHRTRPGDRRPRRHQRILPRPGQ